MSAPEQRPKTLFPVWGKQLEFLDAKEPIKGFVGGIGAGKSKIGAYDLFRRVKPGRLYAVTAPTYRMLKDATFRSFVEVGRQCGQLGKVLRGDDFSAKVRAGSGWAEVLFRSTDNPDSLRGPNLSGVWMDEGSLSHYDAFQIMVGRLREAGESGWLTVTFTPKGMGHWTYEVFGKLKPGVFLVRARTSENPFLSEEFVKMARDNHAGLRGRQELDGEFVSIDGAEWPPEYFPDAMLFDDFPDCPWLAQVMALDPSKGKANKSGDYSAWIDLRIDGDLVLWADANLDNSRPIESLDSDPGGPSIIGDGLRLIQARRPQAIVVETNGFQEMVATALCRALKARGMLSAPVYTVNNTEPKETRIRSLGPYLAQKRLRIRKSRGGELLLQQMRDFPMGEHDDGPDALKLAEVMADFVINGKQQGSGQPQILRA